MHSQLATLLLALQQVQHKILVLQTLTFSLPSVLCNSQTSRSIKANYAQESHALTPKHCNNSMRPSKPPRLPREAQQLRPELEPTLPRTRLQLHSPSTECVPLLTSLPCKAKKPHSQRTPPTPEASPAPTLYTRMPPLLSRPLSNIHHCPKRSPVLTMLWPLLLVMLFAIQPASASAERGTRVHDAQCPSAHTNITYKYPSHMYLAIPPHYMDKGKRHKAQPPTTTAPSPQQTHTSLGGCCSSYSC